MKIYESNSKSKDVNNDIKIELLNDIDFYKNKSLKSGIIKVDKIIALDDYKSALIIHDIRYDILNEDYRII